ncbi:MAG: hypothetical protein K6G51_05750 [Sphaerochaetaceae bacterium]|nr:hypothetical protein [Sphaerochaetaceae bacterium]
MLKKFVLLLLFLTFAVFMFVPIQNRIIYYGLLPLMMFWALIFHFLEDSVSLKELKRKLGKEDFFSIKAGYIFMDGPACILTKGMLVINEGNVLFYKRDKGNKAKLIYSFPVDAIIGYTLGKVDEYHPGVTFTVEGEKGEVRFTGKDFASREGEFRKALGWPEE